MSVTILHTSDLHSRLDDRQAEALCFLREETGALLLDSGDALAAGNVYVLPREPVLARMNAAGYHAMAMGNREFFFRRRGLAMKTRAAQFPVLAANVVPVGGELKGVRRWTVLRTGGESVGVFGLAPTMVPPGAWYERFANVRFIDWQEAVAAAVEALRGRCAWLLALSHRGPEDDLRLAASRPEIDVILGGHCHAEGEHLVGSRPTLVSYAGAHARDVSIVRMQRGDDGHNHFERRLMGLT